MNEVVLNIAFFDVNSYIGAIIVYLLLTRIFGRRITKDRLIGMALFSMIIENIIIVMNASILPGGVYDYYWYANHDYFSHYVLGGSLVWFGVTPLALGLGWFVVTTPIYIVVRRLLPQANIWLKAGLTALLAVMVDLVVDPVAAPINHWWTWTLESTIYIIGVPLVNWVGWFVLVFCYEVIFERTLIKPGHIPLIKKLEQKTYMRKYAYNGYEIKDLPWEEKRRLYYYRLAIGVVVVILLLIPPFLLCSLGDGYSGFPQNW